jgi:hypothetical protein
MQWKQAGSDSESREARGPSQGQLTSGTTGERAATCGCACWRKYSTIWSADRLHDRAPETLSRVKTPTKRFGKMHSHRVNSRRMAVCSRDDVYAYTWMAALSVAQNHK